MKNNKYSIIAFVIAFVFWFFDASIHYFVYSEEHFEFFPSDFNELWMRVVIILLAIFFGVYVDYSTRKLLISERQLEATRIYNSMTHASQHILNNLVNQMQLFKIEALKSSDFNREIIKLYDTTIDEATDLVQRLSQVEDITEKNIKASIDPNILSHLPKTIDAKRQVTDL